MKIIKGTKLVNLNERFQGMNVYPVQYEVQEAVKGKWQLSFSFGRSTESLYFETKKEAEGAFEEVFEGLVGTGGDPKEYIVIEEETKSFDPQLDLGKS